MSEAKLLQGLKVVNLGVGMAPALAAKFLAHAGADVTRVAPAGGDPFAAIYPSYDVWQRVAREDTAAAQSPEKLDALLAGADICIIGGEDHPEIVRRTDAAAIAARHPKLVVLDITRGPAGTSLDNRPSTDLIAQVRSGLAYEQLPDRPIVNGFEPGNYGAALQGIIGILAAIYEREASGKGQIVTTSLYEGCLTWIAGYWATLEKPNPAANFVIPRGVVPLVFKAKDGKFIHIVLGSAGSKYGMYKVLGIDDPSVQPNDSGMPQPGGGPRTFFGDCDLLEEYVAKKTSTEILNGLWEIGLPAEPILEPGVCWDDPQIIRNKIIATDADGTRHVALPFLYETNKGGAPRKPSGNPAKPLEGVRVIDCGAFVAGPLGSVILADLGAEVIKVEAQAGDPNRSIFKSYTAANRGKKDIAVDLKDPDGRKIVQALCKSADVVMNNFRPGVSARLGVDKHSLHALNPQLIVLESPAYGSEGPLSPKAGFDMVMQAWCGHEAKAGGRGNDPFWNRTNLADYTGGQLGAVAMLSGLVHRARSGDGVSLEVPLVNAGIYALSELVQRPDGRFEGSGTLSSSVSGSHPAECLYKAKDGWVAIVARGDKAALQLRHLLGLDSKIGDNVASWGEPEEAIIASAVAGHDSVALAALLEPANIWVEYCHEDREKFILHNPELLKRGTARAVRHPTFGMVNELSSFVGFSRSATGTNRAAPLLGADSEDVLRDLGYSQTEIDDFAKRGVITV